MPTASQLEGPTEAHERLGEWQGGQLRGDGAPLLDPVKPKPQIAIRLLEPFNSQARELAGRRGQPVGRVLADLLAKVLPLALAEELARGERDVGGDHPEEVAAGGA